MEFSHGTFLLRVTRFVKLASFLESCSTAMAFSQFSCSFQSITETACSYYRLDKRRSLEITSLRNCSKNITDHCSYWSFSGVNTEKEPLLARVGVSKEKETSARKLDTVCPYHRESLSQLDAQIIALFWCGKKSPRLLFEEIRHLYTTS